MDWVEEALEVAVNNSPSALYNNLSSDGERLVYCSKAHVCVIPDRHASGSAKEDVQVVAYKDTLPVFDAKALRLDNGMPIIAVLSRSGAHIFSTPATKLAVVPVSASGSSGRAVFMRGACVVPGADCIAFGGSNGSIVLCTTADGSYAAGTTLTGDAAPITALAASARHLVAADDDGNVMVWVVGSYQLEHKFRGAGYPCTGVAVRGDSVAAAFASGHVRVFSLREGTLMAEATGHSRCVAALALHPTEDMFVTAGEDTIVNVWELPAFHDKSSSSLRLLASRLRPDMQIVGVQFSRVGSNLVAAAYDWPALHVWQTL